MQTRCGVVAVAMSLVAAGVLADEPVVDGAPLQLESTRVKTRAGALPADELAAPTTVERDGWVSVQVNLGAAGLDVVGDAANEPSLAVDPTAPLRLAVGWRQFDTIASSFRQAGVAFSTDGGSTWSEAEVLDRGNFRSDPVLASLPDGGLLYYSLRGSLLCDLFTSVDGGRSWTGPAPAFGGDKAWVAVDHTGGPSDGFVYVSWSIASNPWGGNRVFIRSTDGGLSFSEPRDLLPAPVWGSLAVGPEGELYAAGNSDGDISQFVLHRSLDARDSEVAAPTFESFEVPLGGYQMVATGPNPVGLLGQVWVDVDRSASSRRGRVYVLASVDPPGPDPMDVHLAYSDDQGATWTGPVVVATDDREAWQWFGTLAVAPNGRLDVVWVESLAGARGEVGELRWSTSDDGGETFSGSTPVSPSFDSSLGWPEQNKLGDYYHMVSDEVGADLVYAATFNGGQDVWYLRLGGRDCDRNGIADADDLAIGRLDDCNDDGVPDHCQVAAGTLADVDLDGVADVCVQPPRRGGRRVVAD